VRPPAQGSFVVPLFISLYTILYYEQTLPKFSPSTGKAPREKKLPSRIELGMPARATGNYPTTGPTKPITEFVHEAVHCKKSQLGGKIREQ
jgi:hypothetical protein